MMETDNTKEIASVPRQCVDAELPLDTKQIAEAVMELNILRKNVQIYPLVHNQVQRSLGRAHQALSRSLDVDSTVTLGIAKDALMIGNDVLDPENSVFKEFATAMKSHDIAAVTFQNGVQGDELLRFFRMITERTGETKAVGGIETAFASASLHNISIRMVDYSQFCLTENAHAVAAAANDTAEDTDQIWQDFISHFVSGSLTRSEDGVPIEAVESYSPAQLAQALNSGQAGNAAVLDTYDRIARKHLRYTTSKERSDGDVQGSFSNLNLLLQELSPELRRQFLSITFNHCASSPHIAEAETFLMGLSRDFVVDMLRQASSEGKEISPSLLSLIQKITNIEGLVPDLPLINATGYGSVCQLVGPYIPVHDGHHFPSATVSGHGCGERE
jgi:hypothetical protein